jgi:hypothetical protein
VDSQEKASLSKNKSVPSQSSQDRPYIRLSASKKEFRISSYALGAKLFLGTHQNPAWPGNFRYRSKRSKFSQQQLYTPKKFKISVLLFRLRLPHG